MRFNAVGRDLSTDLCKKKWDNFLTIRMES
ncbi:hypothetical protein BCh11DRAFT_06501 [Burkholderia sp. Ch1-1]|nr:hypothetical protein BCh11DRAFT_06501 [Burkholderia sp. Ch1-1]